MVVDKYAISEVATFVMGKTSLFPLYLNVTMIDGILNSFLTDMDTGFHMIQFIIIYSTPWILSAIFLHVYRCIHVGYIHPTCDIRNITIKLGLKSRKPRMKHTTDPHVPVCSKYLQKRTSLCWADMRFPWL